MKEVKTIGETIKSYSSIVTAIFSAAVVLYGVFKFVNTGNQNAENNRQIIIEQQLIRENQRVLLIRIDSLRNEIKTINEQNHSLIRKVNLLKDMSAKQYLKIPLTKEDFLQYMNEMNEKKN